MVATIPTDRRRVAQRIWSSPDAILIIFAGSAAEFALNKAVDWLFWTNALPDAPIERFFETVYFARVLAFGDVAQVEAAVAAVNHAHMSVEHSRNDAIPQWAYRDVLFMLLDYGERAHAIVFGPMTEDERQEHFESSIAIGHAMGIDDLPPCYADYQIQRYEHIRHDLERSRLTDELYLRYRRHLGAWRTAGMRDLQAEIAPELVVQLLKLRPKRRVALLLRVYRRLPRKLLLHYLLPFALPKPFGPRLAKFSRPWRVSHPIHA